MFNASNSLSFFRAPLAFLFLQDNPNLRVMAVLLAMFTDSIDGYVARKNQSQSTFGAILDPTMDKFFVYFSLAALGLEGKLALWQISIMLLRDVFLLLYVLFMFFINRLQEMKLGSILWGKVFTSMQFIVLIVSSLNYEIPPYVFGFFTLLSGLAFLELLNRNPRSSNPSI